MKTHYDDEIREVERRLARERRALAEEAHLLAIRARDAAASPKGLLAALVIGYVLGELTAPRRRHTREAAAATTKKVGLGGLIGSAALAYVRSQYGSPVMLARRAWDYYQSTQRARRAATDRSYAGPVRRYTAPPSASTAPGAPSTPSPATTANAPASTGRAQPVRAPEHHAAS